MGMPTENSIFKTATQSRIRRQRQHDRRNQKRIEGELRRSPVGKVQQFIHERGGTVVFTQFAKRDLFRRYQVRSEALLLALTALVHGGRVELAQQTENIVARLVTPGRATA